jgi:hypothetical protein
MDDLDALIQRQAIADVLIAYCRYLDRMELADLAMLFTEDCTVIYGPDPRLKAEGRPALEASLGRMWRWQMTAHYASNMKVEFESDQAAKSESAVWAWHKAADGSDAEVYGLYHDRFVREPDAWRIAERRMEMTGSKGSFRVAVPLAYRARPPKGWISPEGLDS